MPKTKRSSGHLDGLFEKVVSHVKKAGPTGLAYTEIQQFIVEQLQHDVYKGHTYEKRHVLTPLMTRMRKSLIVKNKVSGNYVHIFA